MGGGQARDGSSFGGGGEAGGPQWQSGFNKTRPLHDRSSFIRCQVSVIQMVMERPGGSFSPFLFYGLDKSGNTRARGDESAAASTTSFVSMWQVLSYSDFFFFFFGVKQVVRSRASSSATQHNDMRPSAHCAFITLLWRRV